MVAAITKLTVRLHGYMAGLSSQAVGSMHDATTGDDAMAHARPQSQHIEIVQRQRLSASQMALSQRRNICVVVKENRNIQEALQRLQELEAIPPRQIWRLMKSA
jgi:hypothetical protein